ncbi:hypothetical protein D1AOALGA4SA_3288 [Olavius algarvensis Delta 1 endosymbiont]|nr:hypothetical protein D1AOALGA4SA_3288 [Olavius algarvensis Delta 1 endosymbiont]
MTGKETKEVSVPIEKISLDVVFKAIMISIWFSAAPVAQSCSRPGWMPGRRRQHRKQL